MTQADFNACAVIPIYNHALTLEKTLNDIRQYLQPVILIDDGSDESCAASIRELAINLNAHLVRRTSNGGKGAAVKDGLREAQRLGYSHALQIDADGQHNSADIPLFLATAASAPNTLIAGMPAYDDSVPKHRYYCRYLTHLWVWINTLSLQIHDSMCGFRVYPVARSCLLINSESMGDRMDYDSEFMVRWHWRHWPIQQLVTKVIYPENGISHFLAWRDNKLITWMHTRLFFGMLYRIPAILANKFRRKQT